MPFEFTSTYPISVYHILLINSNNSKQYLTLLLLCCKSWSLRGHVAWLLDLSQPIQSTPISFVVCKLNFR